MTDAPALGEEPIGSAGNSSPLFDISITDDGIMDGLGLFLETVTGFEIIRGQDNRVPQPKAAHYIVMTPIRRSQLSTTVHDPDPDTATIDITRSTQAAVQLDIYGPSGTDKCQIITTLFRDNFGCEFLAPFGLSPLYCTDGQQMPLVNGEFQYEDRWRMEATLQLNPSVSTPAQFADSVAPNFVEVA